MTGAEAGEEGEARPGDRLAVYGLLRPGASAFDRFGLDRAFRDLGPCAIPGRLHDLGAYPGLVAAARTGGERVEGRLFEIVDASVMADLDAFEDYHPGAPERSRYARVRLRLIAPDVTAWVYVWRLATEGSPRIESGDWLAHVGARESGAR